VQLEQRSEAEAEAVAVSLRKNRPECAVQDKSGLEIGSSSGELDPAYAIAEIESSAVLRGAEEAMQAAAQVRGLADVGFGLGILSTEKEDGGGCGGVGEGFGVAGGHELEALG
jgi:hypothetical protein